MIISRRDGQKREGTVEKRNFQKEFVWSKRSNSFCQLLCCRREGCLCQRNVLILEKNEGKNNFANTSRALENFDRADILRITYVAVDMLAWVISILRRVHSAVVAVGVACLIPAQLLGRAMLHCVSYQDHMSVREKHILEATDERGATRLSKVVVHITLLQRRKIHSGHTEPPLGHQQAYIEHVNTARSVNT